MEVLSLSIDVWARLKAAYNNLVTIGGFDPADLDLKIIQAYGVVTASTQAPVLELNNKNKNKSGSAELPGQELIQDNDGFVAVAGVVGLCKAAAVADLAFARIYPYADIAEWVVAGDVNKAAQSIFSSGRVSMEIGTRTAMQPRLLRFFEKVYNPQAAAAVVPGMPGFTGYTLLDKDFGLNGGERNFLRFDLGQSVLTNIGAATYIGANLIGWGIVDGAAKVAALAKQENSCLV